MSFIERLLRLHPSLQVQNDKRDYVEQILASMKRDGRQMLHVVADFDYTLTMYEKDDVTLPSTHAVVESDDRVKSPDGSALRAQTDRLRKHYRPIEYDPKMSVEEKIPLMIEWWHQAQSLLVESNLNKSMLRDIVHRSNMELRQGVREFISELLQSGTPILIFSAGLGDVIEIFLQKEIPAFKHNHESSHIVSNFIQYNEQGDLLAFDKQLIHSFNKNEYEIHDTPYFQSIVNRPNVILLGDTLGDVGMSAGMKNLKQILKIGFLNGSTPERLEVYQSIFDLVICDNPTFDVPNEILREI